MEKFPGATHEEVAALVRIARLTLDEAQFDELLDAYAHVEAMIARLRRPRAFADEPAHIFAPERFEEENVFSFAKKNQKISMT